MTTQSNKLQTYRDPKLVWNVGVIALLALATRASIAIAFHDNGEDWIHYYSIFSENLYKHFCFSLSDPIAGKCIPETGHYFPGFPAFIATTWAIFGRSIYITYLIHSTLYALTLYYLLLVLSRTGLTWKWMMISGAVLALSPATIGWFRFMLTEPLLLTSHLWFFAALIGSIDSRKIDLYSIPISMSVAIYIRPESVLLLAPLLTTYVSIKGKHNSTLRFSIALMAVFLVISYWPIRNMLLGSQPASMYATVHPKASGYFKWVNTWSITEYERASATFPIFEMKYSNILIDKSLYLTEGEAKYARLLIDNPLVRDGSEFPQEIDDAFFELASRKAQERPWSQTISQSVLRGILLLLNPYSSCGLPLEIKPKPGDSAVDLVKGNASKILGKGLLFLYRLLLMSVFVYATYHVISKILTKRRDALHWSELTLLSCIAYVLTRLIFFVAIGGLEARYMVPAIPWIEVSCCVWCAFSTQRMRATKQSS